MTAQRFLVVVAIFGAAVATGAGTATAEPARTPVNPGAGNSSLSLTVTDDQPSHGKPPRMVLLNCNPSGGTHPHATTACAQLNAAQGDFSKLPQREELCPMVYQPITVTARGEFNGRQVDFQKRYANSCLLDRNTGEVFDF